MASGTLGTNDWYVSDVTVSTTGADTISGPVNCTAAQMLATDTTGQTFAGSCTNNAGLTTDASPLTIKRDASPPSAGIAVTSGTLGTNGWYVSDVTITTTGSDSISSPVNCTAAQTLAIDTAGQDFAGSCTNAAGQTTNAAPLTIKRDATAPSASLAVTAGTLGNGGWYVSDVTISTSGTDSISAPVTCTAPQTLTTDTAGQDFTGSCTNAAGLSTNASTLRIKRDATAPSASLAVTAGTLGNGGWYVSDVTISTSGTDLVSAPVTCTAPQSQTTDTAGQAFAGSCANAAGLTASATPLTVKLDKTAPTIAINAPTNGASYDLNQSVAANYACADAPSGIASCAGPVASGANISTASAGAKTFAVTAVDAAGNSTTQTVGYDVVACHYLTFSASPSTVLRGGRVTLQTTLRSCAPVAETIQVRFTLSAPAASSGCFGFNPLTFTGPSFALAPNTQQTFSFPIFVPFQLCPGTYSIRAETLIAGQVRDTSTVMITVR
jgi:hypothetical protein